ncbi:RNA polymerase sigma factor [Desertimonas flava]|uniref:RNA polymerase sigma factor n=1 Tax=Desertimonas flava TaxID=2064846 RepID=UPI000E34D6EA|nr:sigma-70 family RNA polymerase sigma factor [Desertimonas flava]
MEPPQARPTTSNTRAPRRDDLRDSSDGELLRLVGDGDNEALATLYERHYHDALRFAQRLSSGSGLRSAEDIVAEAVRRVLTALDGGSGPVIGFREYLFTAVRSVSMSPPRSFHVEAPHESPAAGEVPAVDEALDGLVVRQAFASLPARWQHALWMVIVTGMKPIELGPVLGLSPNAVAALVKRARDALRIAYVRAYLPRPAALACRRAIDQLARCTVTSLGDGPQRALDAHLTACDDCRRAAATIGEEIATWRRSTGRTRGCTRLPRDASPGERHTEAVA